MHKYAMRARIFALNPPPQIQFTPCAYKLIEEKGPRDFLRTNDGVPFDPMEIGDLVILRTVHTSHYQGGRASTVSYSWQPATCVSAAEARTFELAVGIRWKEGRQRFAVWRVPYHWRQAVSRLLGQTFDSREELEKAMEVV